jgi:dolichol-phosphate mannosyltransferase
MNNERPDVSIILPTYNEAENIPIIVPRICQTLRQAGIRGEVVVVDDNSPDRTGAIAQKLGEQLPVRTLVRTTERGLATAVIAGFSMAAGRVVVVMDADGSHPVEKLPEMVNPILNDQADATVGSRYIKGGDVDEWVWYRRVVSKTAALMTVGLTTMSDPTSGFMAIKKTLLDGVDLNPIGWKIVLEVAVKAAPKRLLEVPIKFVDRKLGASKMSLKEQRNYLVHLLRLYQFKYAWLSEFFKFCLVGLSGVVVDMGIVFTLKNLFALDTLLCAVFGFLFAVSTNYLLNRYWTFEQGRNTGILRSYLTFVGVSCVGLSVRLGVMSLFRRYTGLDEGYWYLLNNFIGIMVATVVNFIGSKFFAFSTHDN